MFLNAELQIDENWEAEMELIGVGSSTYFRALSMCAGMGYNNFGICLNADTTHLEKTEMICLNHSIFVFPIYFEPENQNRKFHCKRSG